MRPLHSRTGLAHLQIHRRASVTQSSHLPPLALSVLSTVQYCVSSSRRCWDGTERHTQSGRTPALTSATATGTRLRYYVKVSYLRMCPACTVANHTGRVTSVDRWGVPSSIRWQQKPGNAHRSRSPELWAPTRFPVIFNIPTCAAQLHSQSHPPSAVHFMLKMYERRHGGPVRGRFKTSVIQSHV